MAAFAGGDRATANRFNVPVARMRQTATQTLTTAVYGIVTFTTEDYDSHSGHSTSVNTGRYTVQTGWAGLYRLSGGVSIASNATGNRGCRWTKNGTAIDASGVMLPTTGSATAFRGPADTITVDLAVGDYIQLEAFQGSGGNLDTLVSGDAASYMEIEFIRVL